MKSDTRTSNIFGELFNKLIKNIRNINNIQVNTLYKLSIEILNSMAIGKKQNTRSRTKKQ
jgi:hypothetical protein